MGKLAAVGVVLGCSIGGASAGVVTFDPPSVVVDPASAGLLEVEVTINPDFPAYDAAVVLILSDSVPFSRFVFDPEFLGALPTTLEGGLPYDVFWIVNPFPQEGVLYFAASSSPGQASLDMIVAGILTLDLSDLEPGTHAVFVDPGVDGLSGIGNRGQLEPLHGEMTIRVVPEPHTAGLVAIVLLTLGLGPRRLNRRPYSGAVRIVSPLPGLFASFELGTHGFRRGLAMDRRSRGLGSARRLTGRPSREV